VRVKKWQQKSLELELTILELTIKESHGVILSMSPDIIHVLAQYGGGGIFFRYDCDSTITNNTIAENTASYGGGISCGEYSSLTITNTILWNDSPDEISFYESSITITYSDVQGGWEGEGNIDADPMFVGGGDYHLKASSPCIDAGTNDAPALPYTDFEGNDRIIDGNGDGNAIVDMGAYEYVGVGVGLNNIGEIT
jgi:hypothetical protein